MRHGGFWLALCVVSSTALAGCFDPHRVTVPQATLDASGLEWNVTLRPQQGGSFGAKSVETLYSFDPEGDDPPFGGVLQVFSLRGSERKSTEELLRFTREAVSEAVKREGIDIDPSKDEEGTRTLRSGVDSRWFSREGTIEEARGFFFDEDDITVRIHGEVGYDGRSSTSFVAIGFAQVARETSVLPGFNNQQTSQRTWFELVADPKGSVGGASFTSEDRGFIYNLRTHD